MLAGRGMVDHVVAHEMMHGYIRNTVVGAPRWLDEGLAEFYAGLTPVADSVRLGMPEQEYVEELSNHGLMPLRELFTFQPDLILQGDISLVRFYAESWLFAHYLLIGQPARGRQLGDFLARLDDGVPLDDAFQQAFHAKMTDVDADLGAYLRRAHFNYMVYPKSELGEVRPADPQPIGRAETLVALADLLLVTDAWRDAEPFLAKAMELDPKNAAALALMGRFREGAGKLDEAVALYDRAVALDSADVRPFAFASNSLVSRLQAAQNDGLTPARSDVDKARRIAGAGLKRAPSDPDLLATMGATYTFAGEDPKAGIAWSAKAFSIAPSRIDVACDLVLLYARAGKPNLAKAMIDRVIARSERQDLLEAAAQNLTLADFETAEELLGAGKAQEAKLLLEKVRTSTKNPKLKTAAEAKLGDK
ncbi:MAG TPA: tetratricopeptide repeat protein [Thermoanaerobaculia bacterium]|nr:tetratricopeptide repeat protein [Thermoanaerobaculia bacterium]